MISAVSRDADGNLVPEVSAASPAGCAKSKEDRKGKNVIRGWKRERDSPAPPARSRKEKPGDGSSPPPSVFLLSSALAEHHPCGDGPGPCRCAALDSRMAGDNGNNVNNNNNNCGSKATLDCGAIVVRRQHDDTPAAKKHRGAEKVSSFYCLEARVEPISSANKNTAITSALGSPPTFERSKKSVQKSGETTAQFDIQGTHGRPDAGVKATKQPVQQQTQWECFSDGMEG